jgi:hypothetical protein
MADKWMWRSGGLTCDGKEQSLYVLLQEMVYYHSIYRNRLLEYTRSACCINFLRCLFLSFTCKFVSALQTCPSPVTLPDVSLFNFRLSRFRSWRSSVTFLRALWTNCISHFLKTRSSAILHLQCRHKKTAESLLPVGSRHGIPWRKSRTNVNLPQCYIATLRPTLTSCKTHYSSIVRVKWRERIRERRSEIQQTHVYTQTPLRYSYFASVKKKNMLIVREIRKSVWRPF